MFCPQCGKKIKKDAKFCGSCGHQTKNEPQEEAQAVEVQHSEPDQKSSPPAEPMKVELVQARQKWGCGGCLTSILVIMAVFAIFFFATATTQEKASSQNAMIWLLIIPAAAFILWLIVSSIARIIKGFIHKPVGSAMTMGITVIVILISALYIFAYNTGRTSASFNTLQTSFADVLTAKYLGDDIVAGKSTAQWSTVKNAVNKDVETMSKISNTTSFQDYYNQVLAWSKDVNDKASSQTTWKYMTNTPDNLKTAMASSQAKSFFQDSLDRIVATKDFGSWAIAQKDKDTLRSVAGVLNAENYWLNNINVSTAMLTNQSPFASLVITADAATKFRFPRGQCGDFAPCVIHLKKKLPAIASLARNYTATDPNDSQNWQGGWSDLQSAIKIENGYNLGGAGISNSEPNASPTSPMQQAFNDECRAKGGTPGGAGGVKDRLPTTLSAGYNCDYPYNSQTCWDYLTVTGQRFMGGNSGCPEQNLLPRPIVIPQIKTPTPAVNQDKNSKSNSNSNSKSKSNSNSNSNSNTNNSNNTPTVFSWDGTYHINYNQGSCDSSGYFEQNGVDYGAMISPYISPSSSNLVVSNNHIYGSSNNATIDSSGHATGTFSASANYSGAYAESNVTDSYNFTHSGDSASVSGTLTFNLNLGVETARCSQSFSGSR